MYTPKRLTKWKLESNYCGTEYSGYYVFLSKTDADTCVLNESNLEVALAKLGGESETVIRTCVKHFACGHIDLLLIHESDDKALMMADEIAEKLQGYPVLDDNDYSNREFEVYNQDIESWAYSEACRIIGIDGIDLKPENKDRIKRACLDCFYYHGEAYLVEKNLWESLKESKEIVPFSWVEFEKSKGQKFLEI